MNVESVESHYTDQPEDLLITISRIKESSCPFRYFKGYVEQPKPEVSFSSIEAGIGNFFHDYVKNHFKRIYVNNETITPAHKLDISDLITNFRLAFIWEGRLRAPYRVVSYRYSISDFIQRLENVATNFNAFLVKRLKGHHVVEVEGDLQIRTNEFYIRGRHDLVTQKPKRELVLWDWKTGNAPKPEYYEDFRNEKVQLGIYAIWMRHKFGTTNVRGTAVYLREGIVELSERFTPDVEEEVLKYTASWRRQMNKMKNYPPIPNNLCDWCGWNVVCPAYQSQSISIPASNNYRSSKESGMCFIATAVFESSEAPEVIRLRAFRDFFLTHYVLGRSFIKVYEYIGPAIAMIFKYYPLRHFAQLAIRLLIRILPAGDTCKMNNIADVPD